MNKIIKNTLILTIITVVSGLLLGIVYDITKEPIAAAQENSKQEAYRTVLPDAASFEDYEDLSPEEKLEIEKELYREKQIEAGVAPEDISDELPDEILEQAGITPDQTAGEQNSQESAGQGDGTTAQQTSQSQGMPAFSDDMLRMISQEVVQENAEMILAEDANEL